MVATVYGAQTLGIEPSFVDVEIDISPGLHTFSIVGLPDKAVEEARDRITAAVKNTGLRSPQKGNKKIVVSLAPADLKKEGPVFDLAIAMAYLLATEEVTFEPKEKLFLGELSLDGSLRPVRGTLVLAQAAKKKGFKEIYVPAGNAEEAALVEGIEVYAITHLKEVIGHFKKATDASRITLTSTPVTKLVAREPEYAIDFADVRGQESAKRGLLIAAAGKHNIAMYGPPGTGKTMLAKAFGGILPQLETEEIFETTGIHSAAGYLTELITHPPLRAPHHTASHVAIVGGGQNPKPGEITLAHNGILFLDEFPEFDRSVIESLRQPLEDRVVHVSRARGHLRFPANFILIATMNPCPCGNRGTKGKECICTPAAIARYDRKLSGPIIDRIDLWLDVPHIEYEKLSGARSGTASQDVRTLVSNARAIQKKRFQETKIRTNSEMSAKDLDTYAPLSEKERKLLNESAAKLNLSPRAYHRVIKLARTIADLDQKENISEPHLLEALHYRPKTRV